MSWTPYRSTPTIGGMNRKTALVTSASRPLGIGFAVARQLAEQDHHVILTARDLRQADDRASELRRAGLNAVDPWSIARHPERGDDADDRAAAEAARGVVWAATLGADGPTGGLFLDGLDARAVGAA